ncbi:AMT1-1 [Symbiodinium natans]|uniref:AMT1-1 protein n=1 Tax=Symbiodinium natans TaxID=878477 RepID=A0A812RBZ7_9DINO|nr:AMT1-1 [Symbiodinium natans]
MKKLLPGFFRTSLRASPEGAQAAKAPLSALKWTRNSMHWRCLKTGCGNRVPWNANSIFQGLRCLPLVLLRMLCVYAQLDLCSVPRAADVVQHARVGRCKASHFLSALRRAGADATSELFQNAALCGNLEVDATCIGKFHVRSSNVHYAAQIAKLNQKMAKKKLPMPKSFLAHVPVLGIRERSGPPYIWVGDPVLTLPKSRPPTESSQQVASSKLFDLVKGRSRKRCIFPDGNVAWQSAAEARGLPVEPVTHQLRVFTRPYSPACTAISALAGTQCIDRSWEGLKQFLPKHLVLKVQGALNEEVPKTVHQWMWRTHVFHEGYLSPADFLNKLRTIV